MVGRVDGKVALVIGAGSVGDGYGNGKAAAVLYAREGAKIFAVDIDGDAVAETRKIIEDEGGTCETHSGDAMKSDQVEAMVESCMATFGRIDILHNNCGGSIPGGPAELLEEDWDFQIDFNLKTVFLACKYVLPIMEKQGKGAIVNISSIASMTNIGRDLCAYQASKSGLIQFSHAIAYQYAAKGVRCNCVVPGLMHTPLVEARVAGQAYNGDVARAIADRDAMCPTGKMGDAWDVAYAALYLASDEAKYVTGAEIVVDGGVTLKSY
tara:strand:+ start:2555 stop:3355 length:801 start_codon:yes stop_codon:yes gene_type:complete